MNWSIFFDLDWESCRPLFNQRLSKLAFKSTDEASHITIQGVDDDVKVVRHDYVCDQLRRPVCLQLKTEIAERIPSEFTGEDWCSIKQVCGRVMKLRPECYGWSTSAPQAIVTTEEKRGQAHLPSLEITKLAEFLAGPTFMSEREQAHLPNLEVSEWLDQLQITAACGMNRLSDNAYSLQMPGQLQTTSARCGK